MRNSTFACKGFQLLSVPIVNDEAFPVTENLPSSPMHLVIVPAAFIYHSIVGLKDTLPFSDTFSMFTLVFIASQIESEAEALSSTPDEHSLIAKSILEEHVSYSMHLSLGVKLTEVDIAVINSLLSVDSLNYDMIREF